MCHFLWGVDSDGLSSNWCVHAHIVSERTNCGIFFKISITNRSNCSASLVCTSSLSPSSNFLTSSWSPTRQSWSLSCTSYANSLLPDAFLDAIGSSHSPVNWMVLCCLSPESLMTWCRIHDSWVLLPSDQMYLGFMIHNLIAIHRAPTLQPVSFC